MKFVFRSAILFITVNYLLQIFCASGVSLPSPTGSEELRPSYLSDVWVCTATHSASRASIIDANRPAEVLLSFEVCSSHLLCISAVPGNFPTSYITSIKICQVIACNLKHLKLMNRGRRRRLSWG